MQKEQMNIVVVGHVDHGKSTLIGRLLYDTDSLPEGKFEELKAVSEKRNMPLEWSFVLDAFQAERDQAVTIDTTRIWFKTDKRDYVIIDAPGHREFLKNMISGAAGADAAVLVVDAAEGLKEQTRRHAYLLHLLGLKQIVVVINKMDLVKHDATRFNEVSNEVTGYLEDLGLSPMAIVPISARHGDGIATISGNTDWYEGQTLLKTLDRFVPEPRPVARPLRFPVQDVYKFEGERILVGRIEAGRLAVGDTVMFSPANRCAVVTAIKNWPEPETPQQDARAGDVIGIELDQRIFVERGDIGSHADHAPVLTNVFRANIFWLSDTPLIEGKNYMMKLGTRLTKVRVQSIDHVVDTESLKQDKKSEVKRNDMAEVTLRAQEMLALDPYTENPSTGRCVLIDGFDTVGGGIIHMKGYPDQRGAIPTGADNLYEVDHLLTMQERMNRNGHKGAVVWFTGLSGAGKSTLAMRVERALFVKGYQTYVLDGDNVRKGLNADLGFKPEDRTENIRRVGEVAALQADAGLVSLSAFISPYREDRKRARAACPDGDFHEVYIKADVETCESRDPKGLYKKARTGEIPNFTGISSPYEAPDDPELTVDTMKYSIEECVAQIVEYIEKQVALTGEGAQEKVKSF